MIYFIDIDETICTNEKGPGEPRDYVKAQPILENINKVNKLFDDGHTIIYYTARGAVTEMDWRDVTEKQFKDWGVKYHELRLDKPHYDMLIDDKSLRIEEL